MSRHTILVAAVAGLVLALAGTAQAVTVTWDGSTDMNWDEPDSTSWSGGTYNSGDTAQFLGSGTGTVNVAAGGVTPGAVSVNAAGNYTFSGGGISGGGTLAKAGAGLLTLSNANTYEGGTAISVGTILANNTSALGSGTVTLSSGARLKLGVSGSYGNNITAGGGSTIYTGQQKSPVYNGTITLSGTPGGTPGVTLPSGAVTFSAYSSNDTQTFTHPIGGTGDLVFRGGGAGQSHNHIIVLQGGVSTYTGNTWLYDQSNYGYPNTYAAHYDYAANVILKLDGGALPSTTVLTMVDSGYSYGSTTFRNDSVLDLNGNDQTLAGLTNGTIPSGGVSSGIGQGWFVSNSSATLSTLTINNSANWTFGGVIGVNSSSGTGQAAGTGNIALVKSGAGTLTLSGANTYTGTTTISAGKLQIGNAGTTGSLSTSSTIINNGILAFNRTDTITQGSDFAAGISGTGSLLQAGTGTTALSGTNTYEGGTSVTAGALSFRNTAAKPSSGTVDVVGGATLGLGIKEGDADYFSFTDMENLFAGNFVGNLSNVTHASNANVGIDTSAGNLSYASNISSTRGLTKLGNNALTLSGDNAYTGVTTVSAGTLSVSSLANAGANSNIGAYPSAGADGLVLGDGGTLQYTGGTVTVDRGFTLSMASSTIDVSTPGATLTLGDCSGSGTLIVTGGPGSGLSLGAARRPAIP